MGISPSRYTEMGQLKAVPCLHASRRGLVHQPHDVLLAGEQGPLETSPHMIDREGGQVGWVEGQVARVEGQVDRV